MTPRIEHLGIAVRSLEEARRLWVDVLGFSVRFEEEVESEGVAVLGLEGGGPAVELLCPTSEGGAIARFLQSHGPGLHHVAVEVGDLEAALARLAREGVRLVDERPRPGSRGTRVAFVHPKGGLGVLLELVEFPPPSA